MDSKTSSDKCFTCGSWQCRPFAKIECYNQLFGECNLDPYDPKLRSEHDSCDQYMRDPDSVKTERDHHEMCDKCNNWNEYLNHCQQGQDNPVDDCGLYEKENHART